MIESKGCGVLDTRFRGYDIGDGYLTRRLEPFFNRVPSATKAGAAWNRDRKERAKIRRWAKEHGHDGDGGIVAEPCEIGCQHAVRRVGMAGGIAHQRGGHLDRLAGDALDRLGALTQQPMHGGADGAVSEQSDPDG